MKYKITEKTLRAIVRNRAELVAEHSAALAKPNGTQDAFELYAQFGAYKPMRSRVSGIKQALTNRQWANVRLVNGTTIDCALPVKRMAEWAKGAGELEMEISTIPGTSQPPKITLRRNANSAVSFYGQTVDAPIFKGYPRTAPVEWLGERIQVNAPANGGEFVL